MSRKQRIQTLFLASGNPDKIGELRQMLEPWQIDVRSVLDYPDAESVEEDQPTLEGNALKKARYWHRKTSLPVLADDTGLEVDLLGGAPGVYSARYAGEDVTYEENVTKLLDEMEGVQNRKARFRTVIVWVGEEEQLFEGVCEGFITTERKGEGGFGYDPVFRPSGYSRTFAELSSDEKNRISHRGRAFRKAAEYLGGGE